MFIWNKEQNSKYTLQPPRLWILRTPKIHVSNCLKIDLRLKITVKLNYNLLDSCSFLAFLYCNEIKWKMKNFFWKFFVRQTVFNSFATFLVNLSFIRLCKRCFALHSTRCKEIWEILHIFHLVCGSIFLLSSTVVLSYFPRYKTSSEQIAKFGVCGLFTRLAP